jgi:Tfp pilus assembly protein PilF
MTTADEYLQQAWRIHQQGDLAQSERAYRLVIEQIPNHPSAWCFLGIALHDQKRYRQAIEAYRRAISIQPQFPVALNNLGNSLRYDYQPDAAEDCFRQAIALKPDYVNAHKNRGTLHVWTGNLDLAFQCYRDALNLSDGDAELHRNLGVLHLLKGNFADGWREYRWRWQCPDMPRPQYSQPVWQGESLAGKTILLYAEQGLGDTLHFIRFAKQMRQLADRVIVHGQPSLGSLLSQMPGIDLWIPNSFAVDQAFDYHCSLIDAADRLDTQLDSIPADTPYITVPTYLNNYWADWFSKLPPGRKIGLAWQGNPDHQADTFRSFPLATFEPLATLNDAQLIAIQHGPGVEQIAGWSAKKPLLKLPEGIDSTNGAFMDTAAIFNQLDLIITSDTSVAHLAGALGRPVWLLLSVVPDWRWLLDRDDTPWYRSMRLFRQRTQGDWNEVVDRIVSELQTE